jgi:hypothetical protein
MRELARSLSAALPESAWRTINTVWMGYHAQRRAHDGDHPLRAIRWLARQEVCSIHSFREADATLCTALNAGIILQRLETVRIFIKSSEPDLADLLLARCRVAAYSNRAALAGVPKFVVAGAPLDEQTLGAAVRLYKLRLREALRAAAERLGEAAVAGTSLQNGKFEFCS